MATNYRLLMYLEIGKVIQVLDGTLLVFQMVLKITHLLEKAQFVKVLIAGQLLLGLQLKILNGLF